MYSRGIVRKISSCLDSLNNIFKPFIFFLLRVGGHQQRSAIKRTQIVRESKSKQSWKRVPIATVNGKAKLVAHLGLAFLYHHAAQRELSVNFELELRSRRPICIEKHVRELQSTIKRH